MEEISDLLGYIHLVKINNPNRIHADEDDVRDRLNWTETFTGRQFIQERTHV